MMLAMSALNILLLTVVWIYRRATRSEAEIDAFSPHSMFMLADSYNRDFHSSDERRLQDVMIKNAGSRDKWIIIATVDSGQNPIVE